MKAWVYAHACACAKRHYYLYSVIFDGEVILSRVTDPEHDLARELCTRGVGGVIEVLDAVTDRPRSRVCVESARLWCAVDGDAGLKLVKYRAPDVAVRLAG